MNDKSHFAVNSLIDQAVNKVVQTIDTSVSQAVLQGAKLAAGNNGNSSGELTPIVGALACDFDACISPWMEAMHAKLGGHSWPQEIHKVKRKRDMADPRERATEPPRQRQYFGIMLNRKSVHSLCNELYLCIEVKNFGVFGNSALP